MVAVTLNQEKKAVEAAETKTEAKNENVQSHVLPKLDSFLFCFPLRLGALIIGWYYAASYLSGSIYRFADILDDASRGKYSDDPESAELHFDPTIKLSDLLAQVTITAVSVTLLVGVYTRKAALLKPFNVFIIFYTMLLVISIFLNFDYLPSDAYIYIFVWFLSLIYTFLVVDSYRRELDADKFSSYNKPQIFVIV